MGPEQSTLDRASLDFTAGPALPDGVWDGLAAIAADRTTRAGGPLIDRAAFDADHFPEAERAAAYQNLLAGSALMTPLASPVRIRTAWYTLGAVRICLFDNIPYRFERTRAKAAFDRHTRVAIQHLYRGDALGNFDGEPAHLAEGSIYGIDFSRATTIVEQRPVRLVLLGLERKDAAAVIPSIDRLHGVVMDGEQARPYLRELYALVPKLDGLRAEDGPKAAAALLSALGQCFTGDPQGENERLALRRRLVVAHMERRIADPHLSPASIAKSLGLSRSALFLPFKDEGGVQRALVDLRLRRASLMLGSSASQLPLSQVAAACGFADLSHFSRQFRRRFGISPSRYRDPVRLDAGEADGPR